MTLTHLLLKTVYLYMAEITQVAVLLSVVVLLTRYVAILSSGIEILPTMNLPHPTREAFPFHVWGNRSSVTYLFIYVLVLFKQGSSSMPNLCSP